jgi:hypothetical protein
LFFCFAFAPEIQVLETKLPSLSLRELLDITRILVHELPLAATNCHELGFLYGYGLKFQALLSQFFALLAYVIVSWRPRILSSPEVLRMPAQRGRA